MTVLMKDFSIALDFTISIVPYTGHLEENVSSMLAKIHLVCLVEHDEIFQADTRKS